MLLPWHLSRLDRLTIMWDVEPDSDAGIASERSRIVDHVRREVRPGSIILLHVMFDSRRESLAAVPGIIRALKEDGYSFATVSELLEMRAVE